MTQWLQLWRDGDEAAIARVTAMVYNDLRRLASYYLKGESNANTLQPTALVHEAWLRMTSVRGVEWAGRTHFISVAATMMRRILVDHARERRAAKRNAPADYQSAEPGHQPGGIDVLIVDQALDTLAEQHPRRARIVELRFFGGLEFQEIADSMGISLSSVERDWRFARAWLQERLVTAA